MSYNNNIQVRSYLTFILVCLLAIVIVIRIGMIQQVEGDKWRTMGKDLKVQIMNVKSTRGSIYADDGSLLATSLPFYRLVIDPLLADKNLYRNNIDSLCFLLSHFYKDMTMYQYKRMIDNARKNGKRYIRVNRQEIGYQDKKLMKKWPLLREGRLKGGAYFEKVEKRFLPFNDLGIRTIGNLNSKEEGIVGIEYSFNSQLTGTTGKGIYQKMAGGDWRPVYNNTKPKDGYDVETTLNVDLQEITTLALLEELEKHEADYGVAVIMEVKTGKIKALSNLSKDMEGKYVERYNYAVGSQGSREPGSTFKLASMIALLEEADIQLDDTVDTGNGELQFFDEITRDHHLGGFGKITIQEVFEKSSNVGIAKLINKYFGNQPEEFINYLRKMRLHQPLNFQIVGEGKPYIKDPSDSSWSGITLPWMSYGYELKMTPLQMLTLYNAVANDGVMLKPLIVRKVLQANHTIEEYKPQIIKEGICSEQTITKVQTMMRGVVERGTASNINTSKFEIAGKTGTAKRAKGGAYVDEYYTSFVGYFPAKDPKYSCIVVIDNPKGEKKHARDVAAPAFKKIADKIYSIEMDLHEVFKDDSLKITGVFPYIKSGYKKQLSYLCNELGISNHSRHEGAEWVKTKVVGNSIFWTENDIGRNIVPDIRGMVLKDALYILENKGLKVFTTGRGRVYYQSLLPGTKIRKGASISIDLNS